MDEYFEEDDKDIEVLYDSTGTSTAVKKRELKESKDVKKEPEEPEQHPVKKMKMGEYFEEDFEEKFVKKEELEESKDVKKEEEDDPEQEELKLMASMNLPTQFVNGFGRYQDNKLKEDGGLFCDLCQVEMRTVQAYNAHLTGKKHLKKNIATRLQS